MLFGILSFFFFLIFVWMICWAISPDWETSHSLNARWCWKTSLKTGKNPANPHSFGSGLLSFHFVTCPWLSGRWTHLMCPSLQRTKLAPWLPKLGAPVSADCGFQHQPCNQSSLLLLCLLLQSYKRKTEAAKKEYLKALAAYRASLVSKVTIGGTSLIYMGQRRYKGW